MTNDGVTFGVEGDEITLAGGIRGAFEYPASLDDAGLIRICGGSSNQKPVDNE